ncbi:MAG: TRAP transporter permease [Acidobacteria bacterium]|nr:TRAP transporter permease [Acidobacteriota bacterium]
MAGLIAHLLKPGSRRLLQGRQVRWAMVLAAFIGLYHLYVAGTGIQVVLRHRAIHLSLFLVLAFWMYAWRQREERGVPWVDRILAGLSAAIGLYYLASLRRLEARWAGVDPLSGTDFAVGLILLLLVLEAARRTVGLPLSLLAVLFLSYPLLGPYLPGPLLHGGFSLEQVLDHLAFTTDGIFGLALGVSSTYIIVFVLFGAFLEKSGAGDTFFDLAKRCMGRQPGGPAQVAVLSSGLFGMISGSPVSNVVTTGAFTIPLMKRLGYPGHFAGAVEAVAATGGVVTPPVMGAVAFLMAEMAATPYLEICKAAAYPAFLYYLSLSLMVRFRALRTGLVGLQPDEIPELRQTLLRGMHWLVPLATLLALLAKGYSAMLAAFWSIVAIVAVSWLRKGPSLGPKQVLDACSAGSRGALAAVMACALAGIMLGVLNLTGLGGKFSALVLQLSGGQLFPTLLLTMLVCLILGMALPISSSYILTAVLAVPALVGLGVDPLPAHLFVVYFSAISVLTPPVALAAYAAAGLADADSNKVAWSAVRLGLVAYVIPFMWIYAPALLLRGSLQDILLSLASSLVGVWALSSGMEGWWRGPLTMWSRTTLLVAGFLLIFPGARTDVAGAALIALALLLPRVGIRLPFRKPRSPNAAAPATPMKEED